VREIGEQTRCHRRGSDQSALREDDRFDSDRSCRDRGQRFTIRSGQRRVRAGLPVPCRRDIAGAGPAAHRARRVPMRPRPAATRGGMLPNAACGQIATAVSFVSHRRTVGARAEPGQRNHEQGQDDTKPIHHFRHPTRVHAQRSRRSHQPTRSGPCSRFARARHSRNPRSSKASDAPRDPTGRGSRPGPLPTPVFGK